MATILRLTGRAFRWVEVDSGAGETRTAEFLALNPAGKIPVAVLPDGTVLRESNAILAHFAEGTPWMPAPGLPRTRVLEWMFFEQYSHEPYVAVARNLIAYLRQRDDARLAGLWTAGYRAFDVMEDRLKAAPWLTDAGATVADLALFAYTHVAGEGEFDLNRHPAVQAWLARVKALPGIETIPPAGA